MSVAERLRALADFEGNQTKLASKINTTSQSISLTINQNRGVRMDTLESIAKAYPQLNMRWFITGEGESGLEEEAPAMKPDGEKDPEKEILKKELFSMYKEKTIMQEEKIRMLEEKIRMLEREIKAHCGELAEKLEL